MTLEVHKYDNILFEILQNEGQITPFLDAMFSFLYRRTDFYKIQTEKNQSLGFPEGVASNLVRQTFMKYYELARENDELDPETEVPEVVAEEVVVDKDAAADNKVKRNTKLVRRTDPTEATDSDCFNGADLEKYKWSQTLNELDVRVKVPPGIVAGKNVQVQVKSNHLSLSVREEKEDGGLSWNLIVDGDFPYRVHSERTIWTLIPGDHVHISMDKKEERLWQFLLEGDPALDTKKMDNTMPMENLDEDSQAVVQELMYNQNQKMMGKPTSKEQKMEKILKEAWDLEGSPFQGQPFDPRKVTISNPEGLSRDI